MLPVVLGEQGAAWLVFGHTVTLGVASLAPLAHGAGWIYGVGAAAGGAWVLRPSWRLARRPGRATAMACFFASLVQLSALLAAAALDAWLR
jgi:protoheme IX farnesyltransferase